jgi:hypothetical protein
MIDVVELVDNNIVAMNDYVEDYMMMIDQLIKKFAKIKNNEIVYLFFKDKNNLHSLH